MKILTSGADLRCAHMNGIVKPIAASQSLVTIDGRPVLVESDPARRPILGCPNAGAMIKPCTSTLAVTAGHSDLLTIDGQRVCLDTVTGLTDGTPPGVVKYRVVDPGQDWVEEG
jgi:hypothetical protein